MPKFTGDETDNLIDRSSSAVADSLDGAGGNDTLLAGSSIDTLVGGTGDDSLSGGNSADTLSGGDGTDTIAGDSGDDSANGGDDNDTLYGASGNDTLVGGLGNDKLVGHDGLDVLSGDDGNDRLDGGERNDTADGGDGLDTVVGADGNDSLLGGADDDSIRGQTGLDTLLGGSGDDTMDGGNDADVLTGGQGADTLIGGAGADRLVWLGNGSGGKDPLESAVTAAGHDLVNGFEQGLDKLDLDAFRGAQDLLWHGLDAAGAGASHANSAWYAQSGGSTLVFADVDGNGAADLEIELAGLLNLNIDDFIGLHVAPQAQDVNASGLKSAPSIPVTLAGTDDGTIVSYKVTSLPGNGTLYADSGLTVPVAVGTAYADPFFFFKPAAGFHGVVGFKFTVTDDSGVSDATPASATVEVAEVAGIDLASLTPVKGAVIYGADADDHMGYATSSAGDVNGDGFDDLLIGAYGGDAAANGKSGAGESYVLFGTGAGFGASLDLKALTPAQGFVIYGADSNDQSGRSVSAAGDVNGDGFDDIIIGAPGGDGAGNARNGAGESYVIFGKAAGFGASLDLNALTSAQGLKIFGAVAGDSSGHVHAAGDINDDGFADFIVGAPNASGSGAGAQAGTTYVLFGTDAGFGASLDLAALPAAKGFVINGIDAADHAGSAVSSAGDVNGDGFDDLIIGAPSADAAGNAKSLAGESYVVFGKDGGFGASLNLATLTAAQGFVIRGANAGDDAGVSVSSAGDVNGDGFGDLIVGADTADAAGNAKDAAGEAYVLFGSAAGFGAGVDLATLTPARGFVIYGADAGDRLGISVSSAGDVNGDGLDDLIVGAYRATPDGVARSGSGESYVIFGSHAGFGASLDLATLTPAQGFVITGAGTNDISGVSVSAAGDVNGDGFDDLLVGARAADAAGNAKNGAGESYVLYGHDFRDEASAVGTADADFLTGTSAADIIVAGRGNDTISGAAGNDAVRGGAGNDTISGGGGADLLDGGSGNDSINGGSTGDTLEGGDGDDTLDGSVGNDRLAGGPGDDLFVFKSGSGVDTIVDFVPGAASGDVIDLRGIGSTINSFADVQSHATDIGTATQIDLGGGDRLVLLGFNPSDLVSSDFLI